MKDFLADVAGNFAAVGGGERALVELVAVHHAGDDQGVGPEAAPHPNPIGVDLELEAFEAEAQVVRDLGQEATLESEHLDSTFA